MSWFPADWDEAIQRPGRHDNLEGGKRAEAEKPSHRFCEIFRITERLDGGAAAQLATTSMGEQASGPTLD